MAPPPLLPLPSPAPAVAPLVKYWVSGGEFGDPYYTFNPPLQPFEPGRSYAFKGGERTVEGGRHPFAIGAALFVDLPPEFDQVGTSILTLGEWTTITIPEEYTGPIIYYCTAHTFIMKPFLLLLPPAPPQMPLSPATPPSPPIRIDAKYWVSGGEFGDPYYNFNPPLQPFEPGKTYAFKGGERTSRDGRHPFALGSEPFVDLPPEFNLVGTSVSTLGEWTQITIPEDYTGQIFYYCTAHSFMAKAFEIAPS